MQLNEPGLTKAEFEQVFKTYFRALHAYAFTFLRDEPTAEEIVQNMFYKIWEKRERLKITQSLKAYLYQCVYNESLNYLKHLKVKKVHQSYIIASSREGEISSSKILIVKELESKIAETLKQLPEQCRTIFQMSCFENLMDREIAGQLILNRASAPDCDKRNSKKTEVEQFIRKFETVCATFNYKFGNGSGRRNAISRPA